MSLLVTCPNCGPREVQELRCAGESTKRPQSAPTQRELNDYLYVRDNDGASTESGGSVGSARSGSLQSGTPTRTR